MRKLLSIINYDVIDAVSSEDCNGCWIGYNSEAGDRDVFQGIFRH